MKTGELSKFMIFCWATFIAFLCCMRLVEPTICPVQSLETTEQGNDRRSFAELQNPQAHPMLSPKFSTKRVSLERPTRVPEGEEMWA